jgi:hypothetical protein
VLPDVIEQQSPPFRFRRHRRLFRRARRTLRRWRRLGPPTSPAARFDPERAHELSTAELWHAWTLASLECSLELAAWRLAPRRLRPRAFSGYRAALSREGMVAELLAQRH